MTYPVKQPVNINFAQGLNQKVDPYQVPVGNFLSLVNSVFDKVGRLTKRNGYPHLSLLPDTTTSYLTTFNNDLQAVGANLLAYSSAQSNWVGRGSTHPLRLSTAPLVRNSLEQVQADSAMSPNGLRCTAYTETDGSAVTHKYVVADAVTGQNILEPALLPNANVTYGTPRVFILGKYFVIVYTEKVGSPYTLNYLAISYVNPTSTPSTGLLASAYQPATTVAWDGVILNGSLYLAYNGASSSGIKALALSSLLAATSSVVIDAAHQGTLFSLSEDEANQTLWIAYSTSSAGYLTVTTPSFIPLLSSQSILTGSGFLNLTSTVLNNTLTFYTEVANSYGYDSGIPTNYVTSNTCTISGTVGAGAISARSVGLASKAFLIGTTSYYLSAYQSPFQPTYFLIDGTNSTDAAPVVVEKISYSNGGGYLTTGLPNAPVMGTEVQIPYLVKDLLEAQAPVSIESINIKAPQVYTQTGVNVSITDFDTQGLVSAESASNLHLTGGFLWMYDGFLPIEHNFFLWPDSVEATWSATGGAIVAKPDGTTNTNAYYYQVCYEWTDNQGNLFRSTPSIPVAVTTTGSGTAGSVVLDVPTLRLTYKINSPVRIVIYRWSVANQTYYQVTSISTPIQNNTTVDFVTFTDTLADASIVGNNIIYTTGGVLENVNGPASSDITLFDNRVWLLDAEHDDTFWFTKTIVPGSPADFSDLQTYHASPTIGSQGSTGKTRLAFPMDDKLILFKDNAIYYLNGTGPNDTGANNQYSQPIFVTSTVGSNNPRSLAMIPRGLMFQSNKGIWLLGRDLSTEYIGAPVENSNGLIVTSANTKPGTNQVVFTMSDGSCLMYDYFVGQWGVFEGIPALSSTIYNSLHTIVNSNGQVSQEKVGTYLDGPNPVLMGFKTSWLNVAGLRGYLRAYWFYFLGTFLSPHKLALNISYDYNDSASQGTIIAPLNYQGPYGSGSFYGDTNPYGGPGSLLNWQVFLDRQRCKAFQLSMQEVFDPTFGTIAGPGLTLSGLNCIVGVKKAYAPINQNQQAS